MGLIKIIKFFFEPPKTRPPVDLTTEFRIDPRNFSKRANSDVKVSRRITAKRPVKRQFPQLWKERQWRKVGEKYFGYYRTSYGSYQGEIDTAALGFIRYYILNPPNCLSEHSHYACFIPRGGNKYEVHFNRRAKKVDEGIMAIEKILTEAHRL